MKTSILIFLFLVLSAAGSALLLAQEASGPQGQGAGGSYMEERGAVDMPGLEGYMAPEAAPSFQLPAEQSPAVQAEAGSPVLDKALGLVGLPGMSNTSAEESTYEKAWRMSDSPNGGTRLTYGERYRRNPDGSYGAQSSSQWNSSNIGDRLLEQALSAGSGYFSSWAEGWLGGYGKARISVRVNDEGDVTGSGDFLYPIYDSERTTFFTQIGLRTMANDRVIGNFGLGQRFFPANNFALGYNIFIDQDFSRNHTRGGAGLEAWYDWVRLSANYYSPLSGWKDSKDYDSRLVEERPAEGFDARLTGYLPFYRNLAVTGAFEQWKGDHVGAFGDNDFLRKDPKVWSYGLEWTPIPAFSTSVNQRHSGGQKETQFALTFNYNFGMDWEDQLSSSTVAEMRTVDGSRHDFVNRQNEMILEYRAKDGAYNITLRTLDAARNIFEFRFTDGFGQIVRGQAVTVSASGGVTALPAGVFRTDANGAIEVELVNPGGTATVTTVTLTAGRTSRSFDLNLAAVAGGGLTSASGQHLVNSTVGLSFTLTGLSPLDGHTVTWSITNGSGNFGGNSTATSTTDAGGAATASLTGTAQGAVTVRATLAGGYYVEETVMFGTLAYTLAVAPQNTGGDIVASGGSTILKATVSAMFNDGVSSSAAYTGSLPSLTVNWSKNGEYVYNNTTEASTSPPIGALTPTSVLGAGLFSGATSTDASGVATVTFTPGVASGTAGGVQIKAELASDSSVSGTVNVAVGLEWKSNDSNPAGWTSAATIADGAAGDLNSNTYQPGTKLPTFEQLRGISGNIGYRPASLTHWGFWTGVSRGNGRGTAGLVYPGYGLAIWLTAGSTGIGVLALR